MPDAAPAAQTPAGSTATRPSTASASTVAALPARGTLLGFDFGLARIGVATGELETGQASALTTVHDESNDARFKAIAGLIAEWRPVALVVGLPTHLDGTEHALTARCRRFANQLHGRFGLPVFTRRRAPVLGRRRRRAQRRRAHPLARAQGGARRRRRPHHPANLPGHPTP